SLFSIFVQLVSSVALLVLLSHRASKPSLEKAYEIAASKLPGYLWQLVIAVVILMGSYLLLIVPGIVMTMWLMFAGMIYVGEETSAFTSILRSREYVRGYWWAVLGRASLLILAWLVLTLIPFTGFAVAYAFNSLWSTVIFSILGLALLAVWLIFGLILIPYLFFIYESLRSIKGTSVVGKPGPRKSFIALAIFGLLACGALIASVIFFDTNGGVSPENKAYLDAYENNPVYTYDGGYFAPALDIYRNNWREVKEGSDDSFGYVETRRDSAYRYLFDQSRNTTIRLPINGGQSYFSTDGGQTWTLLYIVTIVTKQ
ncbi:MAG TPA: hypothetical protein VI953_04915, partial [Candidatus Paceibacterota bacterium]